MIKEPDKRGFMVKCYSKNEIKNNCGLWEIEKIIWAKATLVFALVIIIRSSFYT